MTEFVLEILDGDRAGEVFPLGDEPLTFGRRKGNTVVLADEKCSGRHAEIALDQGQWVLRDLESTNGTLLDGRRVDEVGLTANDIFQLGVTRVVFKERGAPNPRDDLSVRKLDQATLARTRRGGGIGVLLLLVLVLGGGAVWFFYLRGETAGPVAPGKAAGPLVVAGDWFPEGDFESLGEEPLFEVVSGIGFAAGGGRGANNSGQACLEAVLGEEDTDRHSLVRSRSKMPVSGGGIAARAFFRTTGRAKAALRARFTSSDESLPQVMFTGTVPASCEEYTEVSLDVPVPEGCDRVQLEILALLPDAESTVSVDDVSVVGFATDSAESGANRIQTPVGQRVSWSGSALRIDAGTETILSGVRPLTNDPTLKALAARGLLCLSDVGLALDVTAADGSVAVKVSGVGSGVVLEFVEGIAGTGVLTRNGDAPFQGHGAVFAVPAADSCLFGNAVSRLLVRTPQPVAASGATPSRAYELTLSGASSFHIVYDFSAEREAARNLLEQANARVAAREFAKVLDDVAQLLRAYPHDDTLTARATTLRNEVRKTQEAEVRRIESDLDEARYFASLRGYHRIRIELAKLVEDYSRAHLVQPEKVAAMEARVATNIAAIEAEVGREARGKLEILAEVYGGGGTANEELTALIQNYIETHLPKKAEEKK